MIQAHELRIGNLLNHSHIGFLKVKGINTGKKVRVLDLNQNLNFSFFYEDLKPIELTPELLKKAGFSKLGNGFIIDDGSRNEHGDIIVGNNTFNLFDRSYGKFEQLFVNNTRVNYLHELQNIYFALHKQELNITL